MEDTAPEENFARPLRTSYIHIKCGKTTEIGNNIAETFARDPHFFKTAHCTPCNDSFPVEEFAWDASTRVGT